MKNLTILLSSLLITCSSLLSSCDTKRICDCSHGKGGGYSENVKARTLKKSIEQCDEIEKEISAIRNKQYSCKIGI